MASCQGVLATCLVLALVGSAQSATVGRAATQWKSIYARHLAAAGVPDPTCKTGIISLVKAGQAQVCCAGYCGECSDYATCSNVREQDSGNACCETKVYDMRCGGGAAANVCLKSCSEAVPPCIMDGEAIVQPEVTRHAGDDCNEAVTAWRAKADAAEAAASAPPSAAASAPAAGSE